MTAWSHLPTHDAGHCFDPDNPDRHCPFHHPSDHHMNTWPMTIRYDRMALTERVCEHGVGHPDPDSLAWLDRILVTLTAKEAKSVGETRSTLRVHGCEGCCRPLKEN